MSQRVYKLPEDIDFEILRSLEGDDGNFLNPIVDGLGNMVLSEEEYNEPEFQKYKLIYPDIVAQFDLIEWVPNPDLIINI